MPTLNRYAASNSKTGFFIRANVGGSHPVTLQTTDVASQLFRETGYHDGATLPTKLVWGMYEVELLYTESSLSTQPSASADVSSLSRALDSSALSDATRRELVDFLETYSGSKQRAVERLRVHLQREQRANQPSNAGDATSRGKTSSSSRGDGSTTGTRSRSSSSTKSRNESRSSGDYVSSAPWKIDCPFCSKRVHNGHDAFIHHWAHASSCGVSKDTPADIEMLDGEWEAIVEEVNAEQERIADVTPHSECPYCDVELELRSVDAYLRHWKNGTCSRRLRSLPDDRPTEVPVDIWWEIKDQWQEGPWQPKPESESEQTTQDESSVIGSMVSSVRSFLS